MSSNPTSVPSDPSATTELPSGTRAGALGGRMALRHRARVASLAVLAIGLAVAASGFDQAPGGAAARGDASQAPRVAVVEQVDAAELTPTLASAVLAVPSATPAPEPTEAVEPIVSDAELLADVRANLSSRFERRPLEMGDETVAETTPEVVSVADKLADARARPTAIHAQLSVSVGVKATPKPVVRKPTPKPVVRKPTPKPAVKKVTTTVRTTTTVSNLGQRVVSIAMRYVGYRYTSGGISPSTGFDCSGFTYYVYKRAGRPISRSMAVQYSTGRWISRSALKPGDLVFFKNTYKAGLSHVGIYIGGGRMVNAQSERAGVTTASINSTYWSPRYAGARRP